MRNNAHDIRISASLMCADIGDLAAEIFRARKAGVDLIHFDVMDGCFVENLGFAPWMMAGLQKAKELPFEAHLMIDWPERYIETFAKAGADIIIVHIEACHEIHRALAMIRGLGLAAGVALSPGSGPERLRYTLPYVDLITVMTVSPGFAGGKFIPEMVRKVRDISNLIRNSGFDIPIEVDGNINTDTVPLLAEAGATIFVGGSSGLYLKDKTLEEAAFELRRSANAIMRKEASC